MKCRTGRDKQDGADFTEKSGGRHVSCPKANWGSTTGAWCVGGLVVRRRLHHRQFGSPRAIGVSPRRHSSLATWPLSICRYRASGLR